MKLVSYTYNGTTNFGVLKGHDLYSAQSLDKNLPNDMLACLNMGQQGYQLINSALEKLNSGELLATPIENYQLLAPVPKPTSCRDGYAFRQHVAAARRNRGVEMIKEFDQYPIFYFTNHLAIQGPGEIFCMPDHFQQLDFELEVAIVIGKEGRNIRAADADSYIAGFTIMNDMSARKLQMEEMLLNLGPAKGKDFSTVIGPWLVTPDELEKKKVPAKPGHVGNNYDLSMKCRVNDVLVSEGNMADMDWTFAEIIERCSYGVTLYPGDVIGSGTVGTGCFLELNGTAKLNNPQHQPQWLQPNDTVTMEIDGLGTLHNIIRAEATDWSILQLKKNV
ncbi:MAG: fumarylacetoacetate hydrolase family protein [Sediminibacterium sp.]|nr:fumarylacetoacetate hydrolase family protein [Sediminibacterium sp.]